MASAPTNSYLTPAEYLCLERASLEKHEYVNGQMFAMTGTSLNHRKILRNISRLLEEKDSCFPDSDQARLFIPSTSQYTYADAVMTCGEQQRFQDDALDTLLNPTLIIEILSPSTADYDRGKKFLLYKSIHSFAEYLLVSQDEALVEQRVRMAQEKWEVRIFGALDQHVKLELGDIQLPIASIYAGVLEGPAE